MKYNMTEMDRECKSCLEKITDTLYEQNVRCDCGIESLAEEVLSQALELNFYVTNRVISNPDSYFPRTDHDRICFLLRDIGCKFSANGTSIEIHPDSIITFGGVCIAFHDDGSFKGFEVSE